MIKESEKNDCVERADLNLCCSERCRAAESKEEKTIFVLHHPKPLNFLEKTMTFTRVCLPAGLSPASYQNKMADEGMD